MGMEKFWGKSTNFQKQQNHFTKKLFSFLVFSFFMLTSFPPEMNSLKLFFPNFFKFLLIQSKINHDPIQCFHFNQKCFRVKFSPAQSKLQRRQSFFVTCESKLCFLNLFSPFFLLPELFSESTPIRK